MALRSLNNPIASFIDYLAKTGTDAAVPYSAPQGLTATGGVVSDYTDPGSGAIYRAHIFTSSGTLDVTALGNLPSTASVLMVAGGGGGGSGPNWSGGGGAGGLLESTSFPLSVRNYSINIGAGGAAAVNNTTVGTNGANTTFVDPSGPTTYTANGGGYGGLGNTPKAGNSGGSGGGASENSSAGNATQSPAPPFFTGYGSAGGAPSGSNQATGGGGAAAGAGAISSKYPGTRSLPPGGSAPFDCPNIVGGVGRANTFAYGPTNPVTYAGGGGGGYFDYDGNFGTGGGTTAPAATPTTMNSAPPGGGGGSGGAYWIGISLADRQGTAGSGGGGGGGIETGPYNPKHPNAPQPSSGGNGGSGIVVVRYQIGTIQTGTAKATGGAISYYNNKVIHTFTSSGDFNVTNGPIDVSYVVIAGGGSGGWDGGGGGGAGGVLTNIPGLMPTTQPSLTLANGPVAVQVGGGGAFIDGPTSGSPNGSNSYFGSPRTATGGGGGGTEAPTPGLGQPGGSGGGERINRSVSAGTGTPGQGNPGFNDIPSNVGGGGGGAGTGGPGDSGHGGAGIQAPSMFQNPISQPGADGGGLGYPGPSGYYWFAGGGGGYGGAGPAPKGGGPGGPYAGAGNGGGPVATPNTATSAKENSGSGGGGGSGNTSPLRGGSGGSGIVLIAYPS